MKPFAVTVTTLDATQSLRMQLDASHWMDALKETLSELGLAETEEADVRCKIRVDGAVEVTCIGLADRRFLVVDDPGEMGVTHEELAAVDPWRQSPSLTVDEMRAIGPEDQPQTRPTSRRQVRADEQERLYPAVSGISGDASTCIRESLFTAQGHVPCELGLFLTLNAERSAWTVMCDSRGSVGTLEGTSLSCLSAVPGPVNRLYGRRRFEDPVTLTFVDDRGIPRLIHVRSALWAVVRQASDIQGVMLLLNAPRDTGFSEPEFESCQTLTVLLSERLKAA